MVNTIEVECMPVSSRGNKAQTGALWMSQLPVFIFVALLLKADHSGLGVWGSALQFFTIWWARTCPVVGG